MLAYVFCAGHACSAYPHSCCACLRAYGFPLHVQFAIDFDNIPPLPPPPLPDPTPEILEAMRDMNIYCNLNAIDLEWDFEEYMGGKVRLFSTCNAVSQHLLRIPLAPPSAGCRLTAPICATLHVTHYRTSAALI